MRTWYGRDPDHLNRPRYYFAGTNGSEPAQSALDGGGSTIPVSPTTNRLQAGMGYVHDPSGNLIDTPQGLSFTYDSLSMMISSSVDGASFVYTADDERIGILRPTAAGRSDTWRLRGLDGLVLREYEHLSGGEEIFADDFETGNADCCSAVVGGAHTGTCPPSQWTWIRDYVYRAGKLLGTESTEEGKLHYHLDHLGSPRKVSDSGTTVHVEESRFLPFGEEVSSLSFSKDVPLRFTGHERDAGSAGATLDDVDYMHARYYWLLMGRFLSPDPQDSAVAKPLQSWNKYAYARNIPLRFVDDTGESAGDVLAGFANAFGSNFLFGVGRLEPANDDFATGQAIGDLASVLVGTIETAAGASFGAGGAACTVGTGGACAPAGVPAAAVGGVMVVHGATGAVLGATKLAEDGAIVMMVRPEQKPVLTWSRWAGPRRAARRGRHRIQSSAPLQGMRKGNLPEPLKSLDRLLKRRRARS